MSTPQKFEIRIADDVLDDLQARLARVRLPHDFANDDWRYGPPRAYLLELIEYWKTEYDWRAVEAAMNRYEHYRVELDGAPIHFMRVRGKGENPTPLILTHGWPWSFWDYRDVLEPLTDPVAHGGSPEEAFDLVVPSLPGFGFSTPLTRTGINPRTTADLWARLMTEVLGYDRFAAAGGDWGNAVTGNLGHKYADRLIGIHTFGLPYSLDLFTTRRVWDPFGEPPASLPAEEQAAMIDRQRLFIAHIVVHMIDPETLAYALHDSPVGLLAWLLRRRHDWGDIRGDVESRFSKDDLITNAMMYWVTEAFVTAARFYSETGAAGPFVPAHDRVPRIEAPTGVSLFLPDMAGMPPAALDFQLGDANVVAKFTHEDGGHFAPAENPQAVVDDLRATFRRIRATSPSTSGGPSSRE